MAERARRLAGGGLMVLWSEVRLLRAGGFSRSALLEGDGDAVPFMAPAIPTGALRVPTESCTHTHTPALSFG